MGCARISSEFYIRWYDGGQTAAAKDAAGTDGARAGDAAGDATERGKARAAGPDGGGLTREHIDWCLESMRFYGYDATVFYDRGDMVTLEEWREFVADPARIFFCLFAADGTQFAAFWIDKPSDTLRQAFIHFTLLIGPQGVDYLTAFRQAAAWVFEHTRLRQLVGLTPACFRHALGVVDAAGFTRLARLSRAVRVRGRERDAVLSLLSRGDVP